MGLPKKLAQVSAIIFDKTGTLTLGEPRVTQVIPLSSNGNGGARSYTPDEIIAMAAAVEQRHHHPASRAIVKYAAHKQIVIGERTESCQMSGMGVKAKIENKIIAVGSKRLMESEGIDISPLTTYETQMNDAGESLAYVATDGKLIALIAYTDQVRIEAAQAIFELRKLGVQKFYGHRRWRNCS